MSALGADRYPSFIFVVKDDYLTSGPRAGHSIAELGAQAGSQECDATRRLRHSVQPKEADRRRNLCQRAPAAPRIPGSEREIQRREYYYKNPKAPVGRIAAACRENTNRNERHRLLPID